MLSSLSGLTSLSVAVDYGLADDEFDDDDMRGEAQQQVRGAGVWVVCTGRRGNMEHVCVRCKGGGAGGEQAGMCV